MKKQKNSLDERRADLEALALQTDKDIRNFRFTLSPDPTRGRVMIPLDEYQELERLKEKLRALEALITSEQEIDDGEVLTIRKLEDQIHRKYRRKGRS